MMDRLCGLTTSGLTGDMLQMCFTENGKDTCFQCDDSYMINTVIARQGGYIMRIELSGDIQCNDGGLVPLAHYAECYTTTSEGITLQPRMYRRTSHGNIEITNWQD